MLSHYPLSSAMGPIQTQRQSGPAAAAAPLYPLANLGEQWWQQQVSFHSFWMQVWPKQNYTRLPPLLVVLHKYITASSTHCLLKLGIPRRNIGIVLQNHSQPAKIQIAIFPNAIRSFGRLIATATSTSFSCFVATFFSSGAGGEERGNGR